MVDMLLLDQAALNEVTEYQRLRTTRLMFVHGIAAIVLPVLGYTVRRGLEYVKLCIEHGANGSTWRGI